MKSARRGELVTVGSSAKLLASLKKDSQAGYRHRAMMPLAAYEAISDCTPFPA
jgi:hypothetical protein